MSSGPVTPQRAGLAALLLSVTAIVAAIGVCGGWMTGHPWNWWFGGMAATDWPQVVTVSATSDAMFDSSAPEVPVGHYDLVTAFDAGAPLLYVVCKNEGDNSRILVTYGSNRAIDIGSLDATHVQTMVHDGFIGHTQYGDYGISLHKGVGGGNTVLAIGPHQPGVDDAELACSCPSNTPGYMLCPSALPAPPAASTP